MPAVGSAQSVHQMHSPAETIAWMKLTTRLEKSTLRSGTTRRTSAYISVHMTVILRTLADVRVISTLPAIAPAAKGGAKAVPSRT